MSNTEWSEDKSSDDGSEHFFMPLSASITRREASPGPNRRKQRLFSSPQQIRIDKNAKHQPSNLEGQLNSVSNLANDSNDLAKYENQINGFHTRTGSGFTGSTAQNRFPGIDESMDQVFSPPLLMDSSLFPDTYEDLLGMLDLLFTCFFSC